MNHILKFPLQTYIPEEWLAVLGSATLALEACPLEAVAAAQVRHGDNLINGRDALIEVVKKLNTMIHRIDAGGL